ncbi:hypothetical protein D3C72_1703540 [compost metagenome]
MSSSSERTQNGRRARGAVAPRRANRPASRPAATSAADQTTAERQCMRRYSALSRALVLAAAPSTMALSGAAW